MSLRPYQQLKPSGIEYLGAIPNDWPLKRLGDLVAFAQGKAHEPYIDDDGDYICVNSRFVSTSGKTIKTCSVNLTPASLNDILMVMSDLPNGRALARAYYVDDHGKYAVNQRVCRISAEKALPRFLFYLLDRHPGLMQNDDGVHQTHLSNADFQKLKLFLPSVSEQTQIARFLDHETARIDALIEEQQRLIELLKEKRQAVISQAVTKGLDPTVPMRDSGVEWLGEVPAHWGVVSISRIFEIRAGGDLKTEFYSDVQTESHKHPIFTNATNESAIYGYTSKAIFPGGTITVTGRGDVGYAIFRSQPYDAIIRLLVLKPVRDVQAKLYAYMVNAVLTFSVGSSAISQLSAEQIAPYKVLLPPIGEQTEMLALLDQVTMEIDALVNEAHGVISLLQERRSALISAAVTGKIDVRSWQPPASAPTPELAQEAV